MASSCVNGLYPKTKKLGESDRDYIYSAQVADLNIGEIKRGTDFNKIPTASELNTFLNTSLSPKIPDCHIEEKITYKEEKTTELNIEEELQKNFEKLGGDPLSLKQAKCFLEKNKNTKFKKKINGKYSSSTEIKNQDYMVIQDFNQPSSKKRLFLLNLKTGHVKTFFSAHGMGTKDGIKNSALKAEHFSNEKGSNLTPRGFMVSAERVNGLSSGWKWHMKFDGLEKGINDNARDRLVVFHQGVSKDGKRKIVWEGKAESNEQDPHLYQRSRSTGRKYEKWAQGMTWGCTSVASEHVDEVYEKTKGGALFYNYTSAEKSSGENYCGSESTADD